MNLDLDKLEQTALAATPGPWTWTIHPKDTDKLPELYGAAGPRQQICTFGRDTAYDQCSGMEPDQPDMDFIAAANPAVVLGLIARLRDRTKDVQHYEQQLQARVQEALDLGAQLTAEREARQRLQEQIGQLHAKLSEAGWALNPDRMGS